MKSYYNERRATYILILGPWRTGWERWEPLGPGHTIISDFQGLVIILRSHLPPDRTLALLRPINHQQKNKEKGSRAEGILVRLLKSEVL
jgi:hypothetical protein